MILVTGASGMTGRALVQRLRGAGHDVVGTGQRPGPSTDIVLDLLSDDSVRDVVAAHTPSVVFHLAAISAPSHDRPAEIYEANLVGTQRLLAALADLPDPPRRVIVASSATVYEAISEAPQSEGAPIAPKSHYALSKIMVEQLAGFYAKSLSVHIVRPFNYTGPGQDGRFLIPKLVAAYAERKDTLTIGNLDLYRDFSDLDDVVETYARMLDASELPALVNICSGRAFHLSNAVRVLEAVSGHMVDLVVDPRFVRAGEPAVIVGDRSLLDSTIGAWDRIRFEDTIARMYEAALT